MVSRIFLRFASAKRKFWARGGVDRGVSLDFLRVFGTLWILAHWRVPRALAGPPGVIKIMLHPLSKCDPTKKNGWQTQGEVCELCCDQKFIPGQSNNVD